MPLGQIDEGRMRPSGHRALFVGSCTFYCHPGNQVHLFQVDVRKWFWRWRNLDAEFVEDLSHQVDALFIGVALV